MEIIKAGEPQTESTLRQAFAFAEREKNTVVVASTYCTTGAAAAAEGAARNLPVVVVTHDFGFREPGAVELEPEHREAIQASGALIFFDIKIKTVSCKPNEF